MTEIEARNKREKFIKGCSLKTLVFLLSLIDHNNKDSYREYSYPFGNDILRLAPTEELEGDIFDHLYTKDFILPVSNRLNYKETDFTIMIGSDELTAQEFIEDVKAILRKAS
jgi:superfamily II DNA/RNA helicase